MEGKRVVIVGGGVIGCSTAYYLTKFGCQVTSHLTVNCHLEQGWKSSSHLSLTVPVSNLTVSCH